MPKAQPIRGIVNGHWEPSPPPPSKVLTVVRTGVAKLLDRFADHSPKPTEAGSADKEQRDDEGQSVDVVGYSGSERRRPPTRHQ